MSSQDWIEKAANIIADEISGGLDIDLACNATRATQEIADIILQAYSSHCASLPQLQEMAKNIRLQICAATYAAEGGEWSNTSDEAIDAAINYHLAPLYAELERKDATIDRLTKLLVASRHYVADWHVYSLSKAEDSPANSENERRWMSEAREAENCLTRIDKEIGGK